MKKEEYSSMKKKNVHLADAVIREFDSYEWRKISGKGRRTLSQVYSLTFTLSFSHKNHILNHKSPKWIL